MTRVCNMKQNHMENADKKNALYESHITYIPRQLMFITGKTSDTNDFIHYIDQLLML